MRIGTPDWGHSTEEVEANHLVLGPPPNGHRRLAGDKESAAADMGGEERASVPTIPSAPARFLRRERAPGPCEASGHLGGARGGLERRREGGNGGGRARVCGARGKERKRERGEGREDGDEEEKSPGLHPRVLGGRRRASRGEDRRHRHGHAGACVCVGRRQRFCKQALGIFVIFWKIKNRARIQLLLSFGRYLRFQSNSKFIENI